jgi:hypothetical protein
MLEMFGVRRRGLALGLRSFALDRALDALAFAASRERLGCLLLSVPALVAPEFVKVEGGTLRHKGAAFHIAGANAYSLLYGFADAEKQFKGARARDGGCPSSTLPLS